VQLPIMVWAFAASAAPIPISPAGNRQARIGRQFLSGVRTLSPRGIGWGLTGSMHY
jgi:hypothetical protein